MNARSLMIPIALAMLVMAAPLQSQAPPQAVTDFTKAVLAEVRNAQGQVVLSGRFVVTEQDDDETERKARLIATSVDPDARGKAEVEVKFSSFRNRTWQEIDFSVRNVQPGGVFTFVIDGNVFATVTANSRGRAGHERDVPLPAGSGFR